MGISQAHAEYMASAGSVTHYGADGSRPYQRALAAGYPLAGDLSQGGYFSENITAGNGLSAQSAVEGWLGDAPHTNTMLSTYAQDIGAGVATVGGYVYYVIDVGLATGSTPRYTPRPDGTFPTAVYYAPLVSTIMPNTPAADGVVRHRVTSGETLWLIAITYGTKVDAIRSLNNLAPDAPLQPGVDLLIFPPGTVTPPPSMRVQPTMLALLATATSSAPEVHRGQGGVTASGSPGRSPASAATATPGEAQQGADARPPSAPAIPGSSSIGIIVLIVGASLLAAVFFSFRGRNSS
jgi:LysM repeat protein